VYGVWLNINGMWRIITLDSYFPCKKDRYGKLKLFGSRNEGDELWAMLLEKAYAKAYGSYMTIEGRGGSPLEALRDLTGAPCESRLNDKLTEDELWAYLHGAELNNWILACGTNPAAIREQKNELGLRAGHAYTILNSVELNT